MTLVRIVPVLTMLCALSAGNVYGQWRGLQVTYLGPEEGVSVRVNTVIQDRQGYMYMASTRGLIRYDGNTVRYFTHDPTDSTSIGPGEIYGIVVGKDSLLWLGLRYGGLNSFDPKTETFSRFPIPELPYFTIPTAHGLLEDHSGQLWVGGHHFQLLNFNRETGQFTAYTPDWIDPQEYGRRLSVSDILQDAEDPDTLWISVVDYQHPGTSTRSGYGLVSFNTRTGKFVSRATAGRIRYQDSTGLIWTDHQTNIVTSFDPATNTLREMPVNFTPLNLVRHLLPLDSVFWLTSAYAITEFDWRDGSYRTLYQNPTKKVEFHDISRDVSGNIWIGSSPGATVIDPKKQFIRFFSLEQFGIPFRIYPARLAYHPDEDVVYFSTPTGNSGRQIYVIPLHHTDGREPWSISVSFDVDGIAVDQQGEVLISGGNRMHRLDQQGEIHRFDLLGFDEMPMPWLWNMRTHRNGWVAGIGQRQFVWFHPNGRDVKRVHVDSIMRWREADDYQVEFVGFDFSHDKDVAYLTSSVIHRVNLETGVTTLLPYPKRFNPSAQQLTDAIEDYHGHLWISGVNYLGKFRVEHDSLVEIDRFSVRDGLVSNEIHEIFCDHRNRIWLFTTNGMNCIDPETREVRYFGLSEGLPEIAIDPRQIVATPEGEVVTVNSNGIIVFQPDSLWNSLSPQSVKIVLKQIRINGIPIEASVVPNYLKSIHVPLGRNVVDIQFQGLTYPNDEGMQYSYRLDEEKDWIDIGQNKLITLPDLSPGVYTFQVKAGIAQSTAPVRSLVIHVPTPLYKRTWFVISMALLLIILIALGYQYRINVIRRQEQDKAEVAKRIAELELRALRSQMNPHFMFNSLNSIKDFILHSQPERAAEYLSDFAHLIRLILQNSHEKSITLREELETLQLYIDLERLRFDHAFNFQCIVEDRVRLDDVQIPPMLLQPYIENAIWHGLMHKKEQGNLTLHFAVEGDLVRCTVDDDGIGRQKARELKSMSATRYKSMGMGITRDRIEIMNRMDSLGIRVEVIDKTDPDGMAQGTRVVLLIPA